MVRLHPRHHPRYVSWDEYPATRERLRQNVRPRGEGGGAAREGAALLQGILRCGRRGRRMQVAYSGNGGRVPRYACQRGRDLHATGSVCQSLGGLRLERAVAQAFLEAVTPAGIRASAQAVTELERQHEQRLQAQRLAVERAEFEAGRARRQFDACEPEHRLVARTLEPAVGAGARRGGARVPQARAARAGPPRAVECRGAREALARVARDLPRLWNAETTTARDRKQLLRTLVAEAIVTVQDQPRRAEIEIAWEGGARSKLSVPLIRRGPEGKRTDDNTVELIGRLAAHHPDRQIAAILNKQGRRTGTGLPFNKARVKGIRQRAGIPAAPPPDPDGKAVTIAQAAAQLGVSTATIRRRLADGLLPGEQTTPHAPWRIRLSEQIRRRFVPEVRDGFVPLAEAARLLGVARQTVLHKVQRGELQAVQVTTGRRKGLRIQVSGQGAGLFDQ
jgi:excisionase family DNA binding protein